MDKFSSPIPIVTQVLNKWLEVTEYDQSQTSFNLLSANYAFHRVGERIGDLLKFDNTGVFAALYAKASFETICKDIRCKLLDVLNGTTNISDYQEMWDMFNCPEMLEIEKGAIENIVKLTSIQPVLGEADGKSELDMFRDSVEYVAEELTKCKNECFCIKPGTAISKELKFYSTLYVFNTTTECVLNIEQRADGLYLCYITDFNSCGGYFAYIIKSGPNIISINDRIDESYVGQHTRSRNNRFMEDKKWCIFPYNELVEPDGRDYLGYAKSLVCEVKPREIRDFKPSNTYPILLAAVLVISRYAGKLVDELITNEDVIQVYIDSLLKNNSDSQEVRAIVPVSNNSLILSTNYSIPIFDFTSENVKSNELHSKYHWKQDNKPAFSGTFTDINKELIDLYGDGFELDTDMVMRRQWPQLTDGQSISSETIISEFIGPKGKIELEYYRQCRLQLCDHILKGMQVAYNEAGRYQGVLKWYRSALHSNIENIRWMAVDWYIKYLNNETSSYNMSYYSIPACDDMQVSLSEGEKGHWAPHLHHDFVLNEPNKSSRNYGPNRYDLYRCPITGNVANVWFIFLPNTYQNMEILIGCEVPKILKGFKYSGHDRYAGNNLISSTDPVAFIHNPFESSAPNNYRELFPNCRNEYFNIAVGFSKRGLNQLVKQRRAELESLS